MCERERDSVCERKIYIYIYSVCVRERESVRVREKETERVRDRERKRGRGGGAWPQHLCTNCRQSPMCVRKRSCVCLRERDSVCVCDKERERESVCVREIGSAIECLAAALVHKLAAIPHEGHVKCRPRIPHLIRAQVYG